MYKHTTAKPPLSAPWISAPRTVTSLLIMLVCALGCGLSACSTTPITAARHEANDAAIFAALEPNQHPEETSVEPGMDAVPAAVDHALLPPLDDTDIYTPPRFDITATNLDIRAFFAGLAAETHSNVVVHPDISGSISLNLKDVTLDETLNIIQDVYGYYHSPIRGGFQILPNRLQTRIFEIDYLSLKRSGKSSTRVSSGQVSDSEDDYGDADNADLYSNSTSSISGSSISTESETDFWPELQQALAALIGTSEGRNVIIQPHSGLVVVRAMPAELELVERYLYRIQSSLQRQVVLEAKIIEVELSDNFQSGINWGALMESGNQVARIGQIGGGSIFSDGVSSIAGNVANLNPTSSVSMDGLTTSAFGGVFSAALEFDDFQAFIEAAETQGEVRVLSSPRVATVNNQKAVIKVGNDEFFVTDISSDTVTGTTTTTTPDITLTPFFSGIALDVTPQISDDAQVTLHIHPTVSEVTDQTKIITVSGQEQSLPLAYSSVRESDTIVRAASGQIVVIGGLMQESARNNKAGIPGLGKIPGVGALFRHQQDENRKSELVILLRPQIVKNTQDWNAALHSSSTRIRNMIQD